MLRNYFLTGIRNLKRNKVYALLNIIGLALGIGCSLVIFKVVRYELSFDKHQRNFENIYRIVVEDKKPDRVDYGTGVPHPLGPTMQTEFPEIQEMVRTHYIWSAQVNVMEGERIDQKFMIERGVVYTEPSFFKIFDVDWIVGSADGALAEPNTVVLNLSMAKKLFGVEADNVNDCLGETIQVNNKGAFEVIGVVNDLPENTNLPFQILINYEAQSLTNIYYDDGKQWHSVSSSTNVYFQTGAQFDKANMESKFPAFIEKYLGEGHSEETGYMVQPLADIHYSKDFESYSNTVPKQSIYGLSIIAIFLILTACINFINLATAQAANRSKEVGVRKAVGAFKGQLVKQFFLEVLLITSVATIMALAISELLFIYLEEVISYRLTIFPLTDGATLSFVVSVLVLVTSVSALYPSYLLSRMNTVLALKNKITSKNHSGGLSLRKGLVIFQFAISQFMIVGTLVIVAQMDYFLNKELGFDTEAIFLSFNPDPESNKGERMKEILLQSSAIKDVSLSLSAPTGQSSSHSNFNYPPLKSDRDYNANFKPVDDRFLDFYNITLLAGRKLKKQDSSHYVLINRKIADLMGFKDRYDEALGESLTSGWGGGKKVIGVTENFHTKSLHEDLDYVFLMNEPSLLYELAIKSEKGRFDEALSYFEEAWEEVYPTYVNEWEFYDEQLASNYRSERSISTLMKLFSIISIVIGCLGLYGLIAFIAENKMKEIGIRKVLGAKPLSILGLFSKEILILLGVAFFLAAPSAFYILEAWLTDFKFRIDLNPAFFAIALAISALLALLTISHRTISSALLDPAKTLKDE